MGRRSKRILVAFCIAFALLLSYLMIFMRRVSANVLRERIRRNGGIVADMATIERNVPASSSLFGNTTVRIVNPVTVLQMPEAGRRYVIIVSNNDRFIGDVEVAADTFYRLHFGTNAVLSEDIEVFNVDDRGRATYADSGSINYIEIH